MRQVIDLVREWEADEKREGSDMATRKMQMKLNDAGVRAVERFIAATKAKAEELFREK